MRLYRLFHIALTLGAVFVFLVTASPVLADDSFTGKVTAISDGDTIVVKRKGQPVVVQLAAVDAPELSQEYGPKARDFVIDAALGRKVTVEVVERQSRRNFLGRVTVGNDDLALALVKAGLAWAEGSSSAEVKAAEKEAKAANEGLWASANPTPPWTYRQSQSAGR